MTTARDRDRKGSLQTRGHVYGSLGVLTNVLKRPQFVSHKYAGLLSTPRVISRVKTIKRQKTSSRNKYT